MVHAAQAMEDQGPGAAVAAEVAVEATTVAAATHHGVAEGPPSTLLATAVLALGPKPSAVTTCGAFCFLTASPFFLIKLLTHFPPPPPSCANF